MQTNEAYQKDYHTENASFLMYKDWESLFLELENDEQIAKLLKALFAFAKRGEESEFKGALKMAFVIMSQQIERDGKKWETTCKRRKEAGSKGGRPQKPKEPNGFSENQKNQMQPKEPDTDKDTDKDKVTTPQSSAPPKTKYKLFGEYKHIKLSEKQYNALVNDFGIETVSEYIKRCDEYVQQYGKTYKDYNLTIRKWIRKDNEDNGNSNISRDSAASRLSKYSTNL